MGPLDDMDYETDYDSPDESRPLLRRGYNTPTGRNSGDFSMRSQRTDETLRTRSSEEDSPFASPTRNRSTSPPPPDTRPAGKPADYEHPDPLEGPALLHQYNDDSAELDYSDSPEIGPLINVSENTLGHEDQYDSRATLSRIMQALKPELERYFLRDFQSPKFMEKISVMPAALNPQHKTVAIMRPTILVFSSGLTTREPEALSKYLVSTVMSKIPNLLHGHCEHSTRRKLGLSSADEEFLSTVTVCIWIGSLREIVQPEYQLHLQDDGKICRNISDAHYRADEPVPGEMAAVGTRVASESDWVNQPWTDNHTDEMEGGEMELDVATDYLFNRKHYTGPH
ncbi:hypothetical protein F4778DRAFT_750284 [Xylariomycetidae sp. FL2044]|nr:hypothetical protein F4778DRAFT_750284 [Xylariomycetidae sp. FL2044]